MYKLFPYKKNVDRTKLMFADDSYYSITYYHHAKIISNIIKKNHGKNIKIVDMTSNVGGNTISFGLSGFDVTAYEINKQTFEMLKNNVELYKLKNIKLINGDSSNIEKKYDVYFIDAPWGGKTYKEKEKMSLFLGEKNICDIIIDITKSKFKGIYVKVPINFDFDEFDKYIKNFNIKVHKITNKKNKILYNIIEICSL